MKIKNLIIFGTRPEAIKMAPLVHEFQKFPNIFETKICLTAQHREMLDQVMDFFELKADYDLNLMKPNQTLNGLTSDILLELKSRYSPASSFFFISSDIVDSLYLSSRYKTHFPLSL